jgi:iron complex transport system substrate-binding protein
VAAAIGREAAGEALVRGLLERLGRVERRVAGAGRPGVVSVQWLDPVMLGGTWMPELIAVAGGRPLGVAAGQQAPTFESRRCVVDQQPLPLAAVPGSFGGESSPPRPPRLRGRPLDATWVADDSQRAA